MTFLILLLFAILPSFLWLFYYFKKDQHPEPKKTLLYVFSAGAISAFLGYFFQREAISLTSQIHFLVPFLGVFHQIVIIAFSEELFKYLAFFFTASRHRELDEPVDVVVYMITAALGFAALENFLVLSSINYSILGNVISVSALRFLSATLLHALASGILGVFLVYAYRFTNKWFIVLGLGVATVIHAIYNFLIVRINLHPVEVNITSNIGYIESLSPITVYPFMIFVFLFLLFLSLTLSLFIEKIKKLNSVCILKK